MTQHKQRDLILDGLRYALEARTYNAKNQRFPLSAAAIILTF
jgi:hypothetical protein